MNYRNAAYPLYALLVMISITCLFSACSKRSVNKRLSEAESLIVQNPDSAVAILADMDTTGMTAHQKARQRLLYLYIQVVYGNQLPIDYYGIVNGDKEFSKSDEIKWLIAKSAESKRTGEPVGRIESLKDAEFLAIQSNDSVDLGIIYFFLSNVYEQGFYGTVSRYYAERALEIFRKLNWQPKIREARMAIAGAYVTEHDYKTALDSLKAMEPEVMANAHANYRTFFLDQLARCYDANGESRKAIDIWYSIYDGQNVSVNTIAHWANCYCHINELDSAYMLIQEVNRLPRNITDSALCLNVEYDILEKMGRKSELARLDTLRRKMAENMMKGRQLEASSLALNVKYESATRTAWFEASEARNRTYIAILVAILTALIAIAVYVFLRKRNQVLRLEHENDLLKIRTIQDNLFESDRRNKDISSRISELFQTRFKLIDGLASTYFECKDTGQEQKRIYTNVKTALSNFSSNEAIQKLTDIVNGYNDNLMERFRNDFPKLSPSQSRLALYIFCGFSLPSISLFTATELRNIYVYKSRLKSMISKSDSPNKEEYLGYFQ